MMSFSTILLSLSLLHSFSAAAPAKLPRQSSQANDGIHLAVTPTCGTLTGSTPGNVNAGLKPFSSYKNIVVFGDQYSAGGVSNGSALPPAVLVPPNPQAGGRWTDGPLWIEDIANDNGAILSDYAIPGAVTDHTIWPSASGASDLVGQMNTYIGQERGLSPDDTLYVIFFGINDYAAAVSTNLTSRLQDAAETIAYQTLVLSSGPVFAKDVLILDDYGLGASSTAGDQYKAAIFSSLNAMYNKIDINVGFVDFAGLWDGVMSSPGYKAFGYTSDGACLSSSTSMKGECASPATTFYWIPETPSKETHRLMATFVEDAMTSCVVESPIS